MRNDFKDMIRAEGYEITEVIEENHTVLKFCSGFNKCNHLTAESYFDDEKGGVIKIFNENQSLEKEIIISGRFI